VATVVRDGFDLTDPDILADRLPLDEYAYLRENAPVFWNAQAPEQSGHDDGGFWALTRSDDVKTVSTARSGWPVERDSAFVRLLDQSEAEAARGSAEAVSTTASVIKALPVAYGGGTRA
jgi:cholest-4-en-3-one 26-monooxygenase